MKLKSLSNSSHRESFEVKFKFIVDEMNNKSNISVLTSEAGRLRSPCTNTNSKFFFTESAASNVPSSKSKKGKSSTGSDIFSSLHSSKINYDVEGVGRHEGIFGLPHENKTDGISFLGSSLLNLDQNTNPNIIDENQASHNRKTLVLSPKSPKEKTVSTIIANNKEPIKFSVEEAEEYLKSHDIDKIFENYNAEAAQLLTAGFEQISAPYDKALKLNHEMQELQESAQLEIVKLGKRKRDSSEAIELLRTRITILEPSKSADMENGVYVKTE